MNKTFLAALITSAIGIGYIIFFVAVLHRNEPYLALDLGLVIVVEMILMSVTAVVLSFTAKTKEWSRGVLAGAGITLLIGFGICSAV